MFEQIRKGGKMGMMISTRGRYALRVMTELAQSDREEYVPMKRIAEKQNLSLKYLEQILPVFVKNGMLEGIHGKNGGYRLTKAPNEYKIGDILRLTEGDLAPVSCLECNAEGCERAEGCVTLPMWKEFYRMTNAFFDGLTLSDLLQQERSSLVSDSPET